MRDIFTLYWKIVGLLGLGWIADLIIDFMKYGRTQEGNENGEEKKVQNDPGGDFYS